MAEDSMLWTTSGTGDGPGGGYTQQNWLDLHRYNFTPDVEGTQFVLPRKGNKLAVTAGASSVNVDTGAAWVYGFFYKNTTSVNVAISTPALGTTGLRVVLRASWAAQTVRATVIRNSDGVAAVPSATQTPGTTYDVTLATGTITTGGVVTLSDARAYIQPAFEITGSMLNTGIVDNSTIEISSNVLRVKDAGITGAKLNSAIVDNSTIEISANTLRVKDAGITAAKLAAAVAGNGLSGGAGTALAVNVDASTIEINADTLRVKDLGITLAKLAADSVDDTKAGNRVPQFYRRQGGDATQWSSSGATTFTPTSVRLQAGTRAITLAAATSISTTITFPVAFSAEPLIVTGIYFSSMNDPYEVIVNVLSASQFSLQLASLTGGAISGTVNVNWLAMGAE